MSRLQTKALPSKSAVISQTIDMVYYLFPFFDGGRQKVVSRKKLTKGIEKLLKATQCKGTVEPKGIAADFVNSFGEVKSELLADAEYIEANDPASSCLEEVVIAYPGFFAIAVYRLANRLHLLGVPLLPRIMTEYAHSQTGIDIHPGATIGSPFFIDHGTGIVIGESAVIGQRVKLYQGVTIGALSVSKEMARVKRHPTIDNDVVIYAGATILGGKTTIGRNSIIGGNVWLTQSVPPYSVVQQENKVSIKTRDYSLS